MENVIRVKFVGIDNWNRPVFKDVDYKVKKNGTIESFLKGYYLTDVINLFSDEATEQEIKNFYKDKKLNQELVYKGIYPNSEPFGSSIDKKIILV